MTEHFLIYPIVIPFIGWILCTLFSNKQENLIFGITIVTVSIHLICALALTIMWAYHGFEPIFYKGFVLYETMGSDFSINFYFDKITVAYGVVTSAVIFMVSIFSRYYIHREPGFKRFFNNVLFFFLGINIIIFSGNFETIFIGWEIIGSASFLLIAFYRDRYLPVKNALKVVSFYRLADIFLILSIWICHHFFGKSISFLELFNLESHHAVIINQPIFQLLIPSIFLVVCLVKSAQFPFSAWLPRAMEGPTTSSAIFYGSLSVHMGLFLLMRTSPMWDNNLIFKIIVISFGLITTIIATGIASVQSTVKTQIAYSSIAQIGLMFMEVAFGWLDFAFFHFACNAFLRTYQLLVSPSVLSYLIHDQFFNFIAPQHNFKNNLWGKLRLTFFAMNIKEWNLDSFMFEYFWKPLKKTGNSLAFIKPITVFSIFIPSYFLGLYLTFKESYIPHTMLLILPNIFAIIALMLILKAFVERKSAQIAWAFIIISQLFTSLAIGFNEQFAFEQVLIFLSSIFVAGPIGFVCLDKLVEANKSITLDTFHGHSYKHSSLALVFLIACLGLSGFPITPKFIGKDLIMGHIHENQFLLLGLISMSLILDGLAIFRIYARVFLGPHQDTNHELAYRSS